MSNLEHRILDMGAAMVSLTAMLIYTFNILEPSRLITIVLFLWLAIDFGTKALKKNE